MKLLRFIGLLLAGWPLLLTAQTPGAAEIAEKYAQAAGGVENWKKINTMVTESNTKSGGADLRFKLIQVNCKAGRTEYTIMGMTGYTIITRDAGWNYSPFNGLAKAEPMTPGMVKSLQDELCIPERLLTYKENGDKLEYFGLDDVDGIECYKLKLTCKNGRQLTYYIDPENYLLVKKTVKDKVDDQVFENSTFFGNYQKLPEGVVMAFTNSGGNSESEVTKVEINKPIDESVFVPSK